MSENVGKTVTHRRYVGYNYAHYAGNLVDGAYALALFGDVATEMCIQTDGDEGLFVGYGDVKFLAPVRGGDVVEVVATLVREGRRSREMQFEARVVCRAASFVEGHESASDSASVVLPEPIVAVTAVGTVVVPTAHS